MLDISTAKNRDITLDAVKGIGIVLMVVGHSFFSFTSFINLFHMALFFMVSGYLWNDKKAASISTVKDAVLSKVKHLWLPFFICNSGFTLLNNLFLQIGIYSNNPAFIELFPSNVLTPHLNSENLLFELFKHFIFLGDTQLGTATWFLRTLFFVSVVHLVLRYIAMHIHFGRVIYTIAIVFTLVGTLFFTRTDFGLPGGLQSCFPAYTAFLLGTLIRKLSHMNQIKQPSLVICICSFIILLILDSYGSISVGTGKVTGLLFFTLAALSGWFLAYPIAVRLPAHMKAAIAYIGKRSLWLVTLHYLSFKLVTYVYLLVTSGNMLGLAKFPVFGHLTWLKVVYAIVGVTLPLLAERIYSAIKKRIFQRQPF